MVADRFTGWVSIHYLQKEATALKLIDCLKTFFVTFGVPEFLATDHGSQFQAAEMEKFLQTWVVLQHRVSLDYNPDRSHDPKEDVDDKHQVRWLRLDTVATVTCSTPPRPTSTTPNFSATEIWQRKSLDHPD